MTLHNMHREKPGPGDVRIDRATIFGNPYVINKKDMTRERAIELFEIYARERVRVDQKFAERVKGLGGKRLFCWCSPLDCHGRVLEKICKELNR